MQDRRIVELLVRNLDGRFLVLASNDLSLAPNQPFLVSGEAAAQEDDIATLDRILREDLNIFLQTHEAIQIGYDSEYEPGEGVVTRVLYMLKIPSTHLNIVLSERFSGYEWRNADVMRGFEPPIQVLVQTALDFYLPAQM